MQGGGVGGNSLGDYPNGGGLRVGGSLLDYVGLFSM